MAGHGILGEGGDQDKERISVRVAKQHGCPRRCNTHDGRLSDESCARVSHRSGAEKCAGDRKDASSRG